MRTYDCQARKREVLSAVINVYIRTGMPVSSEMLAKDFNCSSATIRNVLSELEEEDYLTHPHTSAGRVPTDKGYRYYVDFLRSQIELIKEEKEGVAKEMERVENYIRRLEDVLEKTSEAISNVTHKTGIVSFEEDGEHIFLSGFSSFVEYPEFRNLERLKTVFKILEEKRRLIDLLHQDTQEKARIYIGKELHWPDVDDCSLIISEYKIKNHPSGRIGVLGSRRMDYERLIPVVEYFSELISEMLSQL